MRLLVLVSFPVFLSTVSSQYEDTITVSLTDRNNDDDVLYPLEQMDSADSTTDFPDFKFDPDGNNSGNPEILDDDILKEILLNSAGNDTDMANLIDYNDFSVYPTVKAPENVRNKQKELEMIKEDLIPDLALSTACLNRYNTS